MMEIASIPFHNQHRNLNAKLQVPSDRAISANAGRLAYLTKDGDSWNEAWEYVPVYKFFEINKSGTAITFVNNGVYLLIEGIQRNNVGFTPMFDVYIVTYVSSANPKIMYSKIYSGQSDITVAINSSEMKFFHGNVTINPGIVAYKLA